MQSSKQIKADLDQAIGELQAIPQSARNLWTCGTGIRRLVDEKSEAILALMRNRSGDPLRVNETLNFVFTELRGNQELAGIKVLADFATSSKEYLEADEQVAPIVERVHNLEEALRDARNAEAKEEQERLDRLEAAKAEAIAKLEAEFAKAEPVPAPEPPRLIRGKNLKPTIASEAEAIEAEEPSFA